jgi:hypothetical protein
MACSPVKINPNFRNDIPHTRFLFTYSSTLKMEATISSEMSLDFQRTIWRYIAEDTRITLHNHSCENLKSYNIKTTFEVWM